MKKDKTVLYAFSKEDLEQIIVNALQRLQLPKLKQELDEIPIDDRMTQQEVSDMFNVTVQSIIAWKKKDLIPYYQIGGYIFYSKKELLAAAKNNPKLRKIGRD